MTGPIRVRWDGGEQTFAAGSTVRLGREPGSEVLLANDNVSRRHAELVDQGGQWLLRDLGSAQGTWVDGQRTTSVPVYGSMSVSLGQSPRGAVVHLIPVDQQVASPQSGTVLPGGGLAGTVVPGHAPPPPAGGMAPPPPSPSRAEGTIIVGGGSPDRPGGRLRDGAVAGATVVTGDVINVECGGSSYSFQPGQTVSLGRDTTCDVVTANPTVSRHHATLRHDGSGWLLEDTGSASGTFVGGKRVTSERLSGSTAAWLGSEDSGERVVLVTSGATREERDAPQGVVARGWLVGAAVFVVLVLIGGVAFAATRSSGASDDALARATVRINGKAVIDLDDGSTCTVTVTGSGSVVDAEEGLILTNAHVVKPSAEGMSPQRIEDCENEVLTDPETIVISITPGLDQPAEPTYVAEVENADGHLDLAVLRVTSTIGGKLLDSGDFDELEAVAIGNSDDVQTGDDVRVFGFPSLGPERRSVADDRCDPGDARRSRSRHQPGVVQRRCPHLEGQLGGHGGRRLRPPDRGADHPAGGGDRQHPAGQPRHPPDRRGSRRHRLRQQVRLTEPSEGVVPVSSTRGRARTASGCRRSR